MPSNTNSTSTSHSASGSTSRSNRRRSSSASSGDSGAAAEPEPSEVPSTRTNCQHHRRRRLRRLRRARVPEPGRRRRRPAAHQDSLQGQGHISTQRRYAAGIPIEGRYVAGVPAPLCRCYVAISDIPVAYQLMAYPRACYVGMSMGMPTWACPWTCRIFGHVMGMPTQYTLP